MNLDIFWLKDDSLEDVDSLPPPSEIAAEIVENLEAALEQFKSVVEELESVKWRICPYVNRFNISRNRVIYGVNVVISPAYYHILSPNDAITPNSGTTLK